MSTIEALKLREPLHLIEIEDGASCFNDTVWYLRRREFEAF
jgi:hypothetical protein